MEDKWIRRLLAFILGFAIMGGVNSCSETMKQKGIEMRVTVTDDDGHQTFYLYNADDETEVSWPIDKKKQDGVVKALVGALRFMLGKKKGALDSEV
jgi:hypothetical protein